MRLRSATQGIHQRVELAMDLDRCLASPEAYRALLEDLLSLYRPLERSLAQVALTGIDFNARRKVPWLKADLMDLGHSVHTLDDVADFDGAPSPTTAEEAAGVLYVLEGASLGGQVIQRRLGPAPDVGPHWAGRFFNGYGKATGAMWRSFVAHLNGFGADPAAAIVITASAQATFAAFASCLDSNRRPRNAESLR